MSSGFTVGSENVLNFKCPCTNTEVVTSRTKRLTGQVARTKAHNLSVRKKKEKNQLQIPRRTYMGLSGVG